MLSFKFTTGIVRKIGLIRDARNLTCAATNAMFTTIWRAMFYNPVVPAVRPSEYEFKNYSSYNILVEVANIGDMIQPECL